MSDEQKNEFWNSSDDDFWNKPVGDAWLKKDNPYVTSHVHEDEAKGSIFHEDMTGPERNDREYETKPDAEAEAEGGKHRIHVHTIICLISIGVMVFVIAAVAVLTSYAKSVQKKEARAVSYKEEKITSPVFDYYDNNTVTLDNNCYTIVNHDVYAGFPDGYSMIAVKVDVESSTYVQNAYAMKNCYIGYDVDGIKEYKQSLGSDVFYPYVAGYGFDKNSFLSDYGCGNASDITGYFFFLIPEEVQEITLYMEKYDLQNNRIDEIETVMTWNMGVLPYDEEIPEILAAEGGYHYE